MKSIDWLGILANLASIITAVVAVFAYGRFLYQQNTQMRALEIYLQSQKESGADEGKRTVMHLMARLAMLRIPGSSGQGFRFDPATHSNLIRSPIPGHPVTLSG